MIINKDINSLDPKFRKKFDLRWAVVKNKYPNASVFEARRSQERQQRLRDESNRREKQGLPRLTWTMQSQHLLGKAVDIVFLDEKGNPTWNGPYPDLIEIAKKYGIRNLAPRETCHFEDDGTELNVVLDPLSSVSKTDKENLNSMKDKGIWTGELLGLDLRMMIIVGRVFAYIIKLIGK